MGNVTKTITKKALFGILGAIGLCAIEVMRPGSLSKAPTLIKEASQEFIAHVDLVTLTPMRDWYSDFKRTISFVEEQQRLKDKQLSEFYREMNNGKDAPAPSPN